METVQASKLILKLLLAAALCPVEDILWTVHP